MSAPPPTSSAIPEHLRPPPVTPADHHHHHHETFPLPKLRLEIRDLSSRGSLRALAAVNLGECVRDSALAVLRHLYRHAPCPLPTTRSVTLVLRDMDGVAYTTGSELDNDHKEIHLSTRHVDNQTPERIRDELCGVVTHELVHCFQCNGLGTCPGGLVEGVADWVRLRCGLVPPHWRPRAEGCSWDAGYETTGYFLDYLERQCGEGTVRRINAKLHAEKYEEDKFWPDLFGSTIGELWETYAASLS
ncbi:PBSP domain protein [Cordyceps fumosorosea ARSEF 2679]|uniref:PBSP domain protein n=1 Tax=Cordyceps fumosorosea (strain ARSEF 2679) TaxID=1081104 RepID=A0A162K684_CORFA|nr:PBSP domain protein [Cordyceps fumosorosea ARSEF 2679]OAA53888.1 PBSP domain protein [Cordyceps fumosorosea ARSEF 2679]